MNPLKRLFSYTLRFKFSFILSIFGFIIFASADIDKLFIGVSATFSKSEVVVLSIESKAYHEWVITLMDGLQQLGFQNLQIKTYTD